MQKNTPKDEYPNPVFVNQGGWSIGYFGCLPYHEGVDLQYSVISQGWPTLLLGSHPPTLTLGRKTPPAQRELAYRLTQCSSWQVYETNRGGELTLHSPQQLIIYPIVPLKGSKQIRPYLTALTAWVCHSLSELGVRLHQPAPSTGIWAYPISPEAESPHSPTGYAKIGSIGVAVKDWHTLHGVALQIEPHALLTPPLTTSEATLLEPCGLPLSTYASLHELGYTHIQAPHIQASLLKHLSLMDGVLRF